jgi:segregation and condensation protein A
VNFVTAGKLVYLAWSILKLQSDKVLLDAMPPEPEADVGGWDLDMFRDPADLDYNQVVLAGTATPLTEAIHREGRRAVTLMELMDAFDEARREAEIQMQLNALREQAVRKFAPNFHQKVHGEDLTEDIALTWTRLSQFNGEPIPLRQLTSGDVWDEVTVFMSLLFLAHLEKVKLWQKEYPHGEIFVKRLSMETDLPTEELLAIPGLGPKPPAATLEVAQ